LAEALQRTSAGIEEKLLPACFHQDAGPESIHGRHRGAGSEEGHLDLLCPDRRWSKSHESKNDSCRTME
jgi:hypothetical protein